ncbi:D-ribose pyranase [Peribacillus butanolivorans]|jgi:D-ribose pyranase|uniref:D-ribose pyranase n=1 Tax=Peribacillus butanolivorans TaxID=421767 RepID=A0AAX0RYG6_9BACI|nr:MULTISPECIES: D-ribose pyranase [Peribacillus]AXN38971.1 D-ribose pyranase [Peribacillus butanolivorans]KON66753.1 ribose ABC transporter [Peribacillus butanolivorans]MBK5444221.1 D-ribose pyranase [Peribacillus sp. TH24]MBK5461074.1 D-ribose pyranase [Peribacillus sp. TH27]MBK5485606.1 D-ribose pyranase [Peribacillus sp. TH16]
MKRHGIINSSIAKVLVDLGHTDYIVIGDCGLPVPSGVLKIDLALIPGTPSFQDVVRAVHEDMVVEKVIAATEVKEKNSKQHQYMEQQFGNAIEYVSHEDFKRLTSKAKAVIRTGETTPYSNCILQSGVFF